MTAKELINIIEEHSLTVRCLPNVVVNYWTYHEEDENKKYVDANGNPSKYEREVVTINYDLEPWKSKFPNGRKFLKETRKVDKGGWWYVKSTKNTNSTVRFNRKYDKFFAPTLEEAIKLFLDSIKRC